MNLTSARDLKTQISKIVKLSTIAVGITVRTAPRAYGVVLLLHSASDGRFLENRAMRAVLRSAGSDVAIEMVGDIVQAGATQELRDRAELSIGASVGHFRGGDGSLGFFGVDRSTGRPGFVSCNHVIALVDRGVDGDAVISPSFSLGGRAQENRVAMLDGRYPRLMGPGSNLTDCAFAILADGVPYDAAQVHGGKLAATFGTAHEQLEVVKIGRITGVRTGLVAKIEVDNIPMRFGRMKVFFDNVIQIGSTSAAPFAAQGDSGALVYATHTFEPLGLLFATSDLGGPYNAGWAWAHPITQVTDTLKIDFMS